MSTTWRPMVGRDPTEQHRTATPLELFVDLTFVVAVAQCATSLHHALSEDRLTDALISYPAVFFAIWWAWMNFTWFASAFDTDDVPYRIATFVQMAGVLVLAAGVPRAFDERDFAIVTLGYVIMRVALVAQWMRAGRSTELRASAHRYALGVSVAQVGWIALLAVPEGQARGIGFVLLVVVEVAVPVWAERAGATGWHPHHIAERYGLFTIIVLGESVLAASLAVQTALDADDALADLLPIVIGGLLTVFAMWWTYFAQPGTHITEHARARAADSQREAFLWGYGHYFVYASAAAVGAGIAVVVDETTGHSELTRTGASLAFTAPVAVFLVCTLVLHWRTKSTLMRTAIVVCTSAVVLATFLPGAVLLTGILLAALVALAVTEQHRGRSGLTPST